MNNASNNRTAPIWLAVRLTRFSLESLGVSRDTPNIIVVNNGRVCDATDNLLAKGIETNMPSATAQLLHDIDDQTPCRFYERELDSESQAMQSLCERLYNFTPHIETYRVKTSDACEDTGLLLELSRCIKLFKGLSPLVELITQAIIDAGFSFQLGQGHSKPCAWLLSYADDFQLEENPRREIFIEKLKPLPLAQLYEFPKVVEQLSKSGFFSFNDIVKHIEQVSMESLRRRFDAKFCEHIAEVLGIDIELQQIQLFQKPAAYYQPRNTFTESIQFEAPISNCELLTQPIRILLDTLTDTLIKQQYQTQEICWNLYDIYHHQENMPIRFERLYRDASLAFDLTMIQLENQPLPFEVDTLELLCEKIMPVHFENNSVGQHATGEQQHELAIVTAKLNARLGENAVFTLSPKDSHIPELSFSKNTATGTSPKTVSTNNTSTRKNALNTNTTDRPSWIFNCPLAIGQRQNDLYWKGKIELLQGPERIEGLWWKKPTARDYFVGCRDDDVRLWVFYDLHKSAWFVHGVFA